MFMALAILFSLGNNLISEFMAGEDIMQIFLKSVNTGIIALAVFELAIVINKEYSGKDEEDEDAVIGLRRTIPRFIGTVCIALSLEGLIT